MTRYVLSLVLLLLSNSLLHAQTDSVQILHADNLYFRKPDATTELQILAGHVRLRQNNTFFDCDSCVINGNAHLFQAFGNIHIVDNDTIQIWSNTLRYLTDRKYAYLNGAVRLTDSKATLTTNTLEYDVANKIGTYKEGGRVVNKKSVLTSREGVYYTDLKDFYFRQNVVLKDPAYDLKTDSLIYNTDTRIATFISETVIIDSSKRYMRTKEGSYDIGNRKANFTGRSFIKDGATTIVANQIFSNDSTGISRLIGEAVVRDTAKGQSVLADEIIIDKKRDAFQAFRKPLMIIKQDKDSIYVSADTLFSARLTDLYAGDSAMLDSLKLKPKDSANRYFEAWRNVRVFSDSAQAVSDSLFYSFKDSTFKLFQNPVVWSGKNQVTGDTIFLYTKNKKAHRFRVTDNSIMANEIDPGVYNQVSAVRMFGFFVDGQIDSVRAFPEAKSIYFLQEKDSSYSGVNETASDIMDIVFQKGELYKVVFRQDLKGTLFPIRQKSPAQARLAGFVWYADRRPLTKYAMFE